MYQKIMDFVRKINTHRTVIRHVNAQDVVFMTTRGYETYAEDVINPVIKLNGYWINVSTVKPSLICSDIIFIKTKDLSNWFEIDLRF